MPFLYTDDSVVAAIRELIANAKEEEPGWMLVPYQQFARLKSQLESIEAANARARNLAVLNKTVFEVSQSAANPRPLCTLLHDLIFTVMKDGGNPAYQQSPHIRLVLHQMLHLQGYLGHPAYELDYDDPRRVDCGKDWAVVEAIYFGQKAHEVLQAQCPGAQVQAEVYWSGWGGVNGEARHVIAMRTDKGDLECGFSRDCPNALLYADGRLSAVSQAKLDEKARGQSTQPQGT